METSRWIGGLFEGILGRCAIRWFKHISDASDDDFLQTIEEEFGLEGYARWFKLLECISRDVRHSGRATLPLRDWARYLRTNARVFIPFLEAIRRHGRIEFEADGNNLSITVLGFRRLIGRDSQRLRLAGAAWVRLRNAVLERDGYCCVYCGRSDEPLECDHIIPISRGGTDDTANLATACLPCNRQKKDKTPEEWRAWQG